VGGNAEDAEDFLLQLVQDLESVEIREDRLSDAGYRHLTDAFEEAPLELDHRQGRQNGIAKATMTKLTTSTKGTMLMQLLLSILTLCYGHWRDTFLRPLEVVGLCSDIL
jgi:hypothetical protein